MRIRIKQVPQVGFGLVPEEIRKAWVGMVLESTGRDDQGRYLVNGHAAIGPLKEAHFDAYRWWCSNFPLSTVGTYMHAFPADACEELLEQEEVEPDPPNIIRHGQGGIGRVTYGPED